MTMDLSPCSKIAIFGSRRRDVAADEISAFISFLESEGFRVFLHESFASFLSAENIDAGTAVPVEHVPPQTALVISLGGDGTFLRAARWVGDREIPIMGVNTGHLGYLSACSLSELKETIGEVMEGKITVEKRMTLQVELPAGAPSCYPFALNEVTVCRDDTASVITVKAAIDGYALADYKADGLIVSTPTGSTAYNLSAGGPVLEPTTGCMVVTPIAPHTLSLRPLVIGENATVELEVMSRSGKFRLSLDNRSHNLLSGGKIIIRKAPFAVRVVRRRNMNFVRKLRDKLFWNASPEED